jgi:hypothetical protein
MYTLFEWCSINYFLITWGSEFLIKKIKNVIIFPNKSAKRQGEKQMNWQNNEKEGNGKM